MKAVEIDQAVLEALNEPVQESTVKSTEVEVKEDARKHKGFKKGISGNPAGRPKGALGKSTLIKQAIMAEAEGILLDNAPKVIRTVVEQAKKGCIQSQKLIWQSIIPAKRAVEITAKDNGPAVIKINIETLNTTQDKNDPPVEAEFEVIPNEEE